MTEHLHVSWSLLSSTRTPRAQTARTRDFTADLPFFHLLLILCSLYSTVKTKNTRDKMDTNDPPPFGETTLPSDPAVMFIRQHINNIRPQFEAQEAAKRHSERTALERENAKLKQDAQSLQQKFRELQETMRDIDEKSRANNEKLRANNEKLRALDEANVSEADKNTRWERAVKAAACGPGLAQESTPLELCSCDQHEVSDHDRFLPCLGFSTSSPYFPVFFSFLFFPRHLCLEITRVSNHMAVPAPEQHHSVTTTCQSGNT